ncbi:MULTISPECIES: hypothetical protein [Burkholderia]|jgi:hypothetical protein|uniref:Lipoprotein n=1 Tax=Burkholderia gladioli TaxID=28095 RepID=A0AAW3EVL1_BURGA|nr:MULTISPECIES: hypothetical protein [Burkholderia]AJW95085.1 hypothetical protein BM43_6917 [Burkholderia gladioli]ASD83329.1 hypothetical protein CEJ98_31145 [Burkholderia gladioli pv. gladioli]AWY50756.1 hypothetical protein A8H28_05915 [Burkholderia gladioli pv. gladioli]KAF1059128.1 hypothetical protein LvStA_05723 [Burkholderia gladioli]KGC12612.1 hypothetical protein DM48_850 [Burkholderia gladioli]
MNANFPGRRGAHLVRALLAACALSVLLAACGGDSSDGAAPAPTKADAAPAGSGGASAPVPIVVMPGAGPCPASGTTALPSPSLNAQLRCAP